jgi:hypothetical protein
MLIVALISTVAMLILMGFFMMGSLPLLILKHDTPLDARFIRGLFNLYYLALMVTATVGALCYALVDQFVIAVALACVGAWGLAGRHWFVGGMDAVRSRMTPDDAAAIRRFRQLHVAGMVLNVALLGGFCFGMTRVSL